MYLFGVFWDQYVGECYELSLKGGLRDFCGLSLRYHRSVFLPQIEIVAGGDERWHIERFAQEYSSVLDERLITPSTRLPGHGREADKARNLLAGHGVNFWILDEDRDHSDPA